MRVIILVFMSLISVQLFAAQPFTGSCAKHSGNTKLAPWGWDSKCGSNCEKVAAIEKLDPTVKAIRGQIEELEAQLKAANKQLAFVESQQTEIFNTFAKKVTVQIVDWGKNTGERLAKYSNEAIKKAEGIILAKFPNAKLEREQNISQGIVIRFEASAEELGSEENSSNIFYQLREEAKNIFVGLSVYVWSTTPGQIDSCNL